MNAYEERQEARRERLEARAERLRSASRVAYKRADLSEEATGIPFGQPILRGHHSERRHRAVIDRAWAAMGKAVALSKEAAAVEARAAGVGHGGISSDDPDGIEKLRAKLAAEEKVQEQRKAINAAIRKNARKGKDAQLIALSVGLGLSPALAAKLIEGDRVHGQGIPAYDLQNRAANIRRIKERIAHLERQEAERAPLIEAGIEQIRREGPGGLEIVENLELNRLQLIFPGKPSAEVRGRLKSQGFRWSPSEGAWQRQLNNAARYAASQIEKEIA